MTFSLQQTIISWAVNYQEISKSLELITVLPAGLLIYFYFFISTDFLVCLVVTTLVSLLFGCNNRVNLKCAQICWTRTSLGYLKNGYLMTNQVLSHFCFGELFARWIKKCCWMIQMLAKIWTLIRFVWWYDVRVHCWSDQWPPCFCK